MFRIYAERAMLIDTDVVVWLFRGRESARSTIIDCPTVELSAVTYMELVQGVRDKRELSLLRQAISDNAWRIVPIGEAISHRATLYVENHASAHGLRLADALIAATAVDSAQCSLRRTHATTDSCQVFPCSATSLEAALTEGVPEG